MTKAKLLASSKAITAAVVGAAVTWLSQQGIDVPDWVIVAASSVLLGGVVWVVKNAPWPDGP